MTMQSCLSMLSSSSETLYEGQSSFNRLWFSEAKLCFSAKTEIVHWYEYFLAAIDY